MSHCRVSSSVLGSSVCIAGGFWQSCHKAAAGGGAELTMNFGVKVDVPWCSILGTVSL